MGVGVEERAPGQLLDTAAVAAARGFSPVRAGHDTPLSPASLARSAEAGRAEAVPQAWVRRATGRAPLGAAGTSHSGVSRYGREGSVPQPTGNSLQGQQRPRERPSKEWTGGYDPADRGAGRVGPPLPVGAVERHDVAQHAVPGIGPAGVDRALEAQALYERHRKRFLMAPLFRRAVSVGQFDPCHGSVPYSAGTTCVLPRTGAGPPWARRPPVSRPNVEHGSTHRPSWINPNASGLPHA